MGSYKHSYSTDWKAANVIKSRVDKSMTKVKFPKIVILIMLKIYIFYILFLNNKMKFICISSALLTYLKNTTFRAMIWKKINSFFFKVKFDYWIIGSISFSCKIIISEIFKCLISLFMFVKYRLEISPLKFWKVLFQFPQVYFPQNVSTPMCTICQVFWSKKNVENICSKGRIL